MWIDFIGKANVYNFEVVISDQAIPRHVPDRAYIFNAYRPIHGSLAHRGGCGRWEDYSGPHGMHFAAILPGDPDAEMWLEENERDNAVLVLFRDSGMAISLEE